jgi:hypothetical protein
MRDGIRRTVDPGLPENLTLHVKRGETCEIDMQRIRFVLSISKALPVSIGGGELKIAELRNARTIKAIHPGRPGE